MSYQIDQNYYDLVENLSSLDAEAISKKVKALSELLVSNPRETKRRDLISKIIDLTPDKNIKILDYGCGGGQTVIYLRLLGYDVTGICLTPKEKAQSISTAFNLGDDIFHVYDGKKLPFESGEFDLIFSEQVLEHVMDLEEYYSESARVLKSGGRSYFSFPQRFIPFDTHTNLWFVHYFPASLRDFLYKSLGKDVGYINKILNFKTTSEHRGLALSFYQKFENQTANRLIDSSKDSLEHYEGPRKIRAAVNFVLQVPYVGRLLANLLCHLSNADILLKK